MGAGTESHARFDQYRLAAGRHSFDPRRLDHQPLADQYRLVVLFPGFGPIHLLHERETRLWNGHDAPQVPQRFFQLAPGCLQLGSDSQVGAHPQRPGDVSLIEFIGFDVGRVDHHSVRSKPRQHFGYGLRELAIHFQRHFEPGR